MLALWVSLKENVNCGSRLTDVVLRPPDKCNEKRICKPEKQTLDNKILYQMGSSFHEVISRTHFVELVNGDRARNIMELIFRKALTNPAKISRKIKRVLRVKNSIEIIERFERYREKVKSSHEQHARHPRSTVDGNELLRFYGTIMSCCRDKTTRVSELCRDPVCRVCRIIEAKFETEYTKSKGIQLSRNSEELSDNTVAFSKLLKMERAVIVCRIIAGTVVNKVDEQDEECDSSASDGMHSHSESLIVRDPCAVLPCFVIVFA